jgi:hypothetical protein
MLTAKKKLAGIIMLSQGYARNMSCSHTWDIYIFIVKIKQK